MSNQTYLNIENVQQTIWPIYSAKRHLPIDWKSEFVCFLGHLVVENNRPCYCVRLQITDLPTSGSIYGRKWQRHDLLTAESFFGIVFQSLRSFPNLTVEGKHNNRVGFRKKEKLQNISTKEALETVESWLETIGLPTSGQKCRINCSGGRGVWL